MNVRGVVKSMVSVEAKYFTVSLVALFKPTTPELYVDSVQSTFAANACMGSESTLYIFPPSWSILNFTELKSFDTMLSLPVALCCPATYCTFPSEKADMALSSL